MPEMVPDILIGPSDLYVLTDILHPYAIYVQQIFSSSDNHGIRVADINNLRSRFLYMLRSTGQEPILLTSSELSILGQALDLFLRTIPQVVPQSAERDATLQSCRDLQEYFKRQVPRR